MWTIQQVRRRAPRLLLTLTVFMALSLSMFAPVVNADTTSYTAVQIHDWLVDQISTATVEITDATTVYLDSTDNYMRVDGLSLNVMGMSIGLSPIKFTFYETTNVLILAELDLFGISPKPRIECTATVACSGLNGPLEITGIDSVKVGSFVPTLSSDDLAAIVDVLNQIIIESELEVTPPSDTSELQGISAAGAPSTLHLTWSDGDPTDLEASYLQTKINGMVATLETKATTYLQNGEGDWNIVVEVVSNTSLDVTASLTAFGITATLDVPIAFSTLTATITNATFSIGDEAPKTVTFSAEALVGCSNYIPKITMHSFVLGNEHPELQDYVATIEEKILSSVDDAFANIMTATGLKFPYWSIAQIAVETNMVVLYDAGQAVVEKPLMTPGWHMLSVPFDPQPATREDVFPDATDVWAWNGASYTAVGPSDDVLACHGYWVRMEIDDPDFAFHGVPMGAGRTLALVAGWNMVGVATTTAANALQIEELATGQLQTDYIYLWDPAGKTYGDPVATLEPGNAYWLASTDACTLVLS